MAWATAIRNFEPPKPPMMAVRRMLFSTTVSTAGEFLWASTSSLAFSPIRKSVSLTWVERVMADWVAESLSFNWS